MENGNRLLRVTLTLILIFAAVPGCVQGSKTPSPPQIVKSPFSSFRDIPGVTDTEIAAIEALQKERDSFVYGMTLTTESFIKENGDTGGYAALFCEWLTKLFDIQFDLEFFLWTELHGKLSSGEIDFSGHMMPDEESLKTFYMTDYIAARQFIVIRLQGSRNFNEILAERPLRYAFTEGSPTEPAVAAVTRPGTYEPIWLNDYTEAYDHLANGNVDAFITTSAAEVTFLEYNDLVFEDFFPLIFNPVSLATAKPELKPIISVVNKALRNGATPYLNDLYNKGYNEYRQHKFLASLNEEEKAYLQNTASIQMAAIYFNYPIVFYNTHEKKWDGVAFDLLHEVEKITGLSFEVINDNNTEVYDLMQMLSEDRVHMLAYLIYSSKREPYYIWGKHKLMTDKYALLSKIDFPNVNTNEIPFARIALIKDTAYAEMFREWFPNAVNSMEYENPDAAFLALDKGEVDMVMAAKSSLLYFANYYEFSGYKANYLFNFFYEPAFAYNKNQVILRSIMDKALSVINTDVVTEQWLTKTHDYQVRIMSAQRPWLIGAVTMSFIVLILLFIMLYRNRGEGKRLEELVAQRTKEIREAEMRTEKLLKEMDTLILITEIESDDIIFVNEKIKKDFKFTDSVIGEKCWKVFYENDFPVERCSFCPKYNPVLNSGGTVAWERFIPTTNRHYKIISRYIDWPGGSKVYLQQYDDITEIKESMAKIRETDEYTQLLLDATPLCCQLWNRNIETINCNQAAVDLYGFKNKQEYIEKFMEYTLPKYQPDGQPSDEMATMWVKRAFEEGYCRFESTHRLLNGEPLPAEITLVRVKHHRDGYLVAGYTRDLREHKKYIDEINANIENLHEAIEYTQILLDATPMGCSIWNRDFKIITCNKETLALYEIKDKKQFIENFYSLSPEFQPCGISSRELSKKRVNEAFEEGYCHTEWMHQTYNGKPLPCELILVRVKYKNEYLVAAYVRDLREQKANLAEINEARDAAEAASSAKSIFLANMSHEIRTPMNAVLGMAELLLYENLNERQLRCVEDIKTSAMSLLGIINDILDVSKIQSGKFGLIPVHYDFELFIDNIRAIAQHLVKDKKVTFKLIMEKHSPLCLYGDDIRLRQVFLNLLSNSIKFTEKGYIQMSVAFTDTTVKITISDTGVGIPPKNIPTLFNAFEQADVLKNRSIKGTGLGLTITKSIVEMMGGEIKVESKYGHGTSFYIEIPKVLGDATFLHSLDSKEHIICAPDAKILVVDDNQTNLSVATGLLQICQISADTASSGMQAIQMVQNNQYDLVFMDHRMPEMSGIETTEAIRQLGISIPIIALTASVIAETKEKMLASGLNDYLSKPIVKTELMIMLKKWLPGEKLLSQAVETVISSEPEDEEHKKFWEKIERITGLDMSAGLDRVYGRRDVYEKTLRLMTWELDKSDKNLKKFLSAGDMENFRIEIHGIKGALANIGAMELSAKAYQFEMAAEKLDMQFCVENMPDLLNGLEHLNSELKEAYVMINQSDSSINIPSELPCIFEKMIKFFDEVDLVGIDKEIENLAALNLHGALKEKIERINDMVMMMDYNGATEHIKNLLNGI